MKYFKLGDDGVLQADLMEFDAISQKLSHILMGEILKECCSIQAKGKQTAQFQFGAHCDLLEICIADAHDHTSNQVKFRIWVFNPKKDERGQDNRIISATLGHFDELLDYLRGLS